MPEDIITLKVDTNDFYIIINSMRDDCGCGECLRVTNNLVTQRQEQYTWWGAPTQTSPR